MNPGAKRFQAHFEPMANAIARLDIDQEDRERVAVAVADAISSEVAEAAERHGTSQDTRTWLRGWRRDLFVLLASDPLVPCAGPGDGEPCPHGRVIRIAMHDSTAEKPLPAGRSAAWRRRPPVVRCVSCGAQRFRQQYDRQPYEVVEEVATDAS
jgi:hypothetical protein